MKKKKNDIPVNPLTEEFNIGIAIKKINADSLQLLEEADNAHRHDYHIFLLAEKGAIRMEIDFEQYKIKTPSVLYIHPNQVHRILKVDKAAFYLFGINTDKLNNTYLELLEQSILPAKSISLNVGEHSILSQAAALCAGIFERKNDKLYSSSLKDCCNALAGLIISRYLEQIKQTNNTSRAEIITRNFKTLLERSFIQFKRPSDYANALNISTPYLNECVRQVTGFPVSYHIHQRVILEAKRLLYHSDKSVKEIAVELGYQDHAYFSRFFRKMEGVSALTFRRNIGA